MQLSPLLCMLCPFKIGHENPTERIHHPAPGRGRHSDRELLLAAIEKLKKDHHWEFTSAGSYARKMYSPENHAHDVASTDIILPRIRPHDGSRENPASHELTADVLIPGSSYTIRFVLTVLHAYLHRDCTVDELCARFFISHSTLYDWKRLFEAHAASWDRSLKAATKLCDELLLALLVIMVSNLNSPSL